MPNPTLLSRNLFDSRRLQKFVVEGGQDGTTALG